MKRYLHHYIVNDLHKKMVFLGGPRQVGKTTFAKNLLKTDFSGGEYFNWDNIDDQKVILNQRWQDDIPLVELDEFHKYRRWKSWIKGAYDTKPEGLQYFLTGSARLDIYKKGGDSLLGRYHYWRMHPFTLDELPPEIEKQDAYRRLLTLGGFPEPFLTNNEREARRWRRERFERVIKEDIRELENIQQLGMLGLFITSLRERVGGLIRLFNISQELQVSQNTLKKWLAVVEKMYLAFSIYPLSKKIPRSIQKPPKVYFYDNADVQSDDAAKLENLVATHLLKRLDFIEDYHGYNCSLHYIRDKDGREVDFATVVDGKVKELVEVKKSDDKISPSLRYFTEILKPEISVQLVENLSKPYDKNGIRVMTPIEYFTAPPWAYKV